MPRLVNIFLRGAADGLSLLAPVADPLYRTARPTLALGEDDVLDVGVDGFGLHPGAPRLAELARGGEVCFVPAAGFDGQNRSHFASQALLEASVDEAGAADGGAGWLGALFQAEAGGDPAPFRGVAVGAVSTPMSFSGTADALAVPEPGALRLGLLRRSPKGRGGGYEVVDSPLTPDAAMLVEDWREETAAPQAAVVGATSAVSVMERMAEGSVAAVDPAPFGSGETAARFAAASALLDADLGTEVVQVDLGGWDTHNAQGTLDGVFAALVAGLDAGIGGLVDRHAGAGGGLVIVVMTEFGRRVQENASGGTDHGRGGLAMVVGDGVAGGLRGTWPGLAELDDGDVRAVNDLRVVQAEVAAAVFGVDAARRGSGEPLGLFDH